MFQKTIPLTIISNTILTPPRAKSLRDEFGGDAFMRMTFNMAHKLICLLALCVITVSIGCVSTGGGLSGKVSTYSPDESGREVWTWGGTSGVSDQPAANTGAETNVVVRPLRKGDRVTISLTGIPVPKEFVNVVNDYGRITLPLIGIVQIGGLTTSKAEQLIREAYITKQFYKSIEVIVVSQKGVFYVRGEVKTPGVFPLSSDITLVQGIIRAGGYTDFHKKKAVKLTRAGQTTIYNVEKIEEDGLADPLLRNGDIIVVPRRPW
jgi:polysaccharide export outer membrane protein